MKKVVPLLALLVVMTLHAFKERDNIIVEQLPPPPSPPVVAVIAIKTVKTGAPWWLVVKY